MGTPQENPATESPQIIIPVRDAMPAGLSKVLAGFICVYIGSSSTF